MTMINRLKALFGAAPAVPDEGFSPPQDLTAQDLEAPFRALEREFQTEDARPEPLSSMITRATALAEEFRRFQVSRLYKPNMIRLENGRPRLIEPPAAVWTSTYRPKYPALQEAWRELLHALLCVGVEVKAE